MKFFFVYIAIMILTACQAQPPLAPMQAAPVQSEAQVSQGDFQAKAAPVAVLVGNAVRAGAAYCAKNPWNIFQCVSSAATAMQNAPQAIDRTYDAWNYHTQRPSCNQPGIRNPVRGLPTCQTYYSQPGKTGRKILYP